MISECAGDGKAWWVGRFQTDVALLKFFCSIYFINIFQFPSSKKHKQKKSKSAPSFLPFNDKQTTFWISLLNLSESLGENTIKT